MVNRTFSLCCVYLHFLLFLPFWFRGQDFGSDCYSPGQYLHFSVIDGPKVSDCCLLGN